jgi:UDP-glucose 4-epimerase
VPRRSGKVLEGVKNLITGGAGFIGSHLAEALIERGDEVFVIDDLSTGSIENIIHLKAHPRFHYVIDTIRNHAALVELIDRCDMIYHLAAAVGVKLIVEKPVRTIETNIAGTEIVLQLANKKSKKVLIASTSEVYGKSERVPFNEDDDMVLGTTSKSRWSYACSKAIDEFLALAYHKQHRLPVVISRLFNTVGPRQTGRYGMVIPTLVRQALAGEPLTVYGDGRQTRSFTYVKDVVGALIALAGHPGAVGEVFNVGNDQAISIEDLARLIRQRTGSSSEITYVPYDVAYQQGFEDMRRRVPDIGKVHNLIGFRPTMQIEGIVDAVIAYFRQSG